MAVNWITAIAEVRAEIAALVIPRSLRRYKTGKFYAQEGQGVGALALVLNRLYYIPFEFSASTPIDQLVTNVTAFVAASGLRCGWYGDGGVGFPTNRLVDYGANTLDTTSNGDKTAAVATTLSGIVFLAVVAQGGAPTIRSSISSHAANMGGATIAQVVASTGNCYYEDGVTGALPTTATIGGVTSSAPRVGFRAA